MFGLLVTLIFLFIIFGILCFMGFCCADNDNSKVLLMSVSVIFFMTAGFVICMMFTCTEPQAIDVYRNNTTLQITYQDSIPIDSVVVFK